MERAALPGIAELCQVSVTDDGTDQSADRGGSDRDCAGVVVAMVMMMMHFVARRRRWRWRLMMVARRRCRCMVVHRRWASVVACAVWGCQAGSSERQAGKCRSEDFNVLVHITPSLSFCFVVVRISRLHSVRYV